MTTAESYTVTIESSDEQTLASLLESLLKTMIDIQIRETTDDA